MWSWNSLHLRIADADTNIELPLWMYGMAWVIWHSNPMYVSGVHVFPASSVKGTFRDRINKMIQHKNRQVISKTTSNKLNHITETPLIPRKPYNPSKRLANPWIKYLGKPGWLEVLDLEVFHKIKVKEMPMSLKSWVPFCAFFWVLCLGGSRILQQETAANYFFGENWKTWDRWFSVAVWKGGFK